MSPDSAELEFERRLEFPPAIVFDALIDADLLGGWLAHTVVEPHLGGSYDLVWLNSTSFPPTHGTITEFDEPNRLSIDTDNRGGFHFQLEPQVGGPRGTSTLLTVRVSVSVDVAFIPRVTADWQSSLDQLDALLRGHPVDWANWDRDRSSAWREYLSGAGGR